MAVFADTAVLEMRPDIDDASPKPEQRWIINIYTYTKKTVASIYDPEKISKLKSPYSSFI